MQACLGLVRQKFDMAKVRNVKDRLGWHGRPLKFPFQLGGRGTGQQMVSLTVLMNLVHAYVP
jgi:hypothetical protein